MIPLIHYNPIKQIKKIWPIFLQSFPQVTKVVNLTTALHRLASVSLANKKARTKSGCPPIKTWGFSILRRIYILYLSTSEPKQGVVMANWPSFHQVGSVSGLSSVIWLFTYMILYGQQNWQQNNKPCFRFTNYMRCLGVYPHNLLWWESSLQALRIQ
jgi:hypothetical protein